MDYMIHTVGAVAFAYGTVLVSNSLGIESSPFLLLAGAVAGGLIPDIDTPSSHIGKIVRPLSEFIHKRIGHRTFFHSILFAALAYSLLSYFVAPAFGAGAAIGIISHIVLDLFTPGTFGVALFYPFNKRRVLVLRISASQKK